MALFDWDNDGDKDIFDDSFEYYLFNSHKEKKNSCSDEEALGCLGIIFAPVLLLLLLSMIFDMFSSIF